MTTPLDPYGYIPSMASIHKVFRHASADAQALVESVAPGDRERGELVGSYLDNVWRLLHVHHEGEDEYLTPRLVERATADEAAEAARVAAEHQTLLKALAPAQDALAAWRADPTPATADALVAANARLTGPLTAHLDEEERIVVPLAIRYLAPQEWNQMPGEGLAAFTGDKIWLVIGLIQEQMPAAMVDAMDAHMPAPLAELWSTSGRRQCAEYLETLRR